MHNSNGGIFASLSVIPFSRWCSRCFQLEKASSLRLESFSQVIFGTLGGFLIFISNAVEIKRLLFLQLQLLVVGTVESLNFCLRSTAFPSSSRPFWC